jgi:hypothetical protein
MNTYEPLLGGMMWSGAGKNRQCPLKALALRDHGTNSGRGEDPAKPEAAGADAFDQRTLRYQIDCHLPAIICC